MKKLFLGGVTLLTIGLTGCAPDPDGGDGSTKLSSSAPRSEEKPDFPWDHIEDDLELLVNPDLVGPLSCNQATAKQIKVVNSGTAKLKKFISQCYKATSSSPWCQELVRPNPSSRATFNCTYSASQPHYLIHPDEKTWKHAFGAVKLIKKLQAKGIRVCQIYNWWRPEPYNKNVGGAAGRHPFGTSVDVRFCSNADANKGFAQLCKYRKQGLLRAIGHYGSSSLHFGVGDHTANTWGRSCP